jgi:hypothetical protein
MKITREWKYERETRADVVYAPTINWSIAMTAWVLVVLVDKYIWDTKITSNTTNINIYTNEK